MKKIAIVEDESASAETLKSYLDKYASEEGERFEVRVFGDAVVFLADYSSKYDIVFMDIELPELNGMEAARRLRALDERVMIIFVTNLAKFAINGYEVGAFDFIVKPVSYADFRLKFVRAVSRLGDDPDVWVWVKGKHGSRNVKISQIKYVEVMNHTITYHTVCGDIVSSGTMKAVCRQLGDTDGVFALCNQSYLVNLRYVSAINGYTVTVGDAQLSISYPKRAEFVRAVNLWYSRRGGEK